METSPSGRVLPLRGGDLLSPAVCLICRRPGMEVDETFADPQELFADPKITEDFFGSVYFCESCSLEIAAIFGAKSNREILQLEADLLMYKTISAEQADVIKELTDGLDGITRAYQRLRGDSSTDDSTVASSAVTEAEQDTHEGLSELTEQRADESPVVTESSNDEGPDDVNADASSDVDDFIRNL